LAGKVHFIELRLGAGTRGLAGSQCTHKHGSTVFYIELIIFISKGFSPCIDFLFKISCQRVGGAVHHTAHKEGRRGQGVERLGLARGGTARDGATGSVGEEEERERGTGPG
jgi:hypothetical protein